MAFKSKNKLIYLILLLALLLRLITINQSFWLDEAISAIVVKKYSYSEIINIYMQADFHPPLYYLLLKFWSNIFGFSEFALRSLSILFSLIAILFTYKLSNLLFKNKYVGIFAGLFLATSQFFVYYSQEARMYAPAAAFSVMAVYFFVKTLMKKYTNVNWVYFSFSITCLVFIDYVPVFMLPIFWIYALLKVREKNWWKKFLLSHILLLSLGLLWLPYFLVQLKNSSYILAKLPEWRTIAGGANFKQAALLWMKFTSGRISFFDKKIYYLYVILSSLPFVYVFKNIFKYKNYFLIKIWLTFPIVSFFLASVYFPGFTYFRVTFVYPAFALLVAHMLFNTRNYFKIAFLIIIINIVSLNIYYFDKNQQREQWRQATSYIEEVATEGSLVLFEYPQPFSPYRWYNIEVADAKGALLKITANEPGTEEHIESLIQDKDTVYHFEYLRDLSDRKRLVEEILHKNEFKVISENAEFIGVGKITLWQR